MYETYTAKEIVKKYGDQGQKYIQAERYETAQKINGHYEKLVAGYKETVDDLKETIRNQNALICILTAQNELLKSCNPQ